MRTCQVKMLVMSLLVVLTSLLSAQTNAPAKPDPNYIATPADLKARIPKELRITEPDCGVFDKPDSGPLACKMNRLHGIFVDTDGAVFIGDTSTHRVRVIRTRK